MVKMTQRSKVNGSKPLNHEGVGLKMPETPDFIAKDSFQNHLTLKLFNLKVQVVFNDVLGVATFANLPESSETEKINDNMDQQLLATRYFFSQFWCEFTQEVLVEFYQEDLLYREQEKGGSANKEPQNVFQAELQEELGKGSSIIDRY